MILAQKWHEQVRRGQPAPAGGRLCAAGLVPRRSWWPGRTHSRVLSFAGKVRARVSKLIGCNRELSSRVRALSDQLERLKRLRSFLSPQVAEVIIADEDAFRLGGQRREIAALFCDLRGFTPFSDGAPPDAVVRVLSEYHQAMGELIDRFGGTIEHRAGDGIMVIFNAPLPCSEPVFKGLRLALAMRGRMRALTAQWRERGYALGFGVGMAFGHATLGMVGSAGRFDFVANGRVMILASRLSDEAADGQILLSDSAFHAVSKRTSAECIGNHVLKGFRQPVRAFNVLALSDRSANSRGCELPDWEHCHPETRDPVTSLPSP